MNDPGPRLGRFFQELKRRRVFRATAAYLVVASGVVAVAADAFPALELPPWTVKFVVILAVLGLPVTVALSWAFDVRPSDAADAPPGAEDTSVGDAPSSASDKGTRTRGGSTAPTQRWTAGRIAVVGAVAVLALAGAAMLFGGGEGVDTLDHRVAVLPFENRTGDPALEDLGAVAADWLTDGLTAIDSVQTVPATEVRDAVARAGDADPLPWIADRTRAGLAVTGSYLLIGDSVQLRARLVDPTHGVGLASIGPARSHRSDPTGALASIREQLMTAVATRLDANREEWAASFTQPPKYEAYRRFLVGVELFAAYEYGDAIQEFDRAREADSTFWRPLFFVGSAFANIGQPAREDSVLRIIEPHRGELSEVHRIWLDHTRARLQGDQYTAYRHAHRAYQRAPGSLSRYLTALYAYRTGHFDQAIELLREELRPSSIRSDWLPFHGVLTGTLHALGEHQQELEAAREAQRHFSDRARAVYLEARALAGLGRPEEAEALVDRVKLLSPSARSAAIWTRRIGDALAAHGHGEAARRVFQRALVALGPTATGDTFDVHLVRANLLRRAGRLDEAADHVAEARRSDPDDRWGHALAGIIAAQRGDRELAERIAGELAARDDPYAHGANTYDRTKIRARLGDLDRAVELLRQAHAEGRAIDYWMRVDPDLQPLHGHPGFEEMIAPRTQDNS